MGLTKYNNGKYIVSFFVVLVVIQIILHVSTWFLLSNMLAYPVWFAAQSVALTFTLSTFLATYIFMIANVYRRYNLLNGIVGRIFNLKHINSSRTSFISSQSDALNTLEVVAQQYAKLFDVVTTINHCYSIQVLCYVKID